MSSAQQVGVSTNDITAAFQRTCAFHDQVRGQLEALLPIDARPASKQHEQDCAALRVVRNLLDQLEDRLRKCRLEEASGVAPDEDLMRSLDKARKELAAACEQSLLLVSTRPRDLIREVLQFCSMSGDAQGPAAADAPGGIKISREGSTNGAILQAMSPVQSTAGTWGPADATAEVVSGPVMRRLSRAEADTGAKSGVVRRVDQALPPAPAAGAGSGAGGLAPLGPGQALPERLSLDVPPHHGPIAAGSLIGSGPRSAAMHYHTHLGLPGDLLQHHLHDPEALRLSSSSGAEQWALTAARTAPAHMRVVRDPVHVRPRTVKDNSVSYTLAHSGSPAGRWLGRLGRWLGSAAAAGAMLLAAGIAAAWAVEELSVRMNTRDPCQTEDVLLEPGLPQLRSAQQGQQQQQQRQQQSRKASGDERRRKAAAKDGPGKLQMLLPVFPAPDATVGRG